MNVRFSLTCAKHMIQFFALSWIFCLSADNQTPDVSPVFSGQELPFNVRVELADFTLPNGLQSYDVGLYKGKWLLINGRTNGLHGFNDNPNNFPPQAQNMTLYVIDPIKKKIYSRSLNDAQSGLTQEQIDSLSVTSAQSFQIKNKLYLSGGYGFRNAINNFTTFDVLSIIDIPGLMKWVMSNKKNTTAASSVQQITHPVFQITGGVMFKFSKNNPFLIIQGQNFQGAYFFGNNTQLYSEQVRRFNLSDSHEGLSVDKKSPKPIVLNPNYRRRDLNIVPVLSKTESGKLNSSLVALSGVFTPSGGVWTVPVTINANGVSSMPDPNNPATFKQAMNNYICPTIGLFSKKTGDMYTVLLGGLSYGFFQNGVFQTDSEIPFINQITTIKIDQTNQYSQYLMDQEYPVILSTQSNPGNPLLFGTAAQFIPAEGSDKYLYNNGVFKFDKIKKSILIGYIVGGIQSTLPNTNTSSDSAASPYIFNVFFDPIP